MRASFHGVKRCWHDTCLFLRMTIQMTTVLLIACAFGFGSTQLQHDVPETLLQTEERQETRSFFLTRARIDHLRQRGIHILLTPEAASTQISIDRKPAPGEAN